MIRKSGNMVFKFNEIGLVIYSYDVQIFNGCPISKDGTYYECHFNIKHYSQTTTRHQRRTAKIISAIATYGYKPVYRAIENKDFKLFDKMQFSRVEMIKRLTIDREDENKLYIKII